MHLGVGWSTHARSIESTDVRGAGTGGDDLSVWVGEATLVWHTSMRIYACAFAVTGGGVDAPQAGLLSSLQAAWRTSEAWGRAERDRLEGEGAVRVRWGGSWSEWVRGSYACGQGIEERASCVYYQPLLYRERVSPFGTYTTLLTHCTWLQVLSFGGEEAR